MSKAKATTKQTTINFLKRYQQKCLGYCGVADREGMPNMKSFYTKRANAAKLIIEALSDNSPKPQETNNAKKEESRTPPA